MRFKVEVKIPPHQTLCLPLAYQELIQGLLYHSMPPREAEAAHQQIPGHRKYQKFTFSRLEGRYEVDEKKQLIYFERIYFYVACIDDWLGLAMMKALSQGATLYDTTYPTRISLVDDRVNEGYQIRMLSPLTVRKTDLDTGEVQVWHPNMAQFSQAIFGNLCRKYKYFYGEDYQDGFEIVPKPETIQETVVFYKKSYIKAYGGDFELRVSARAMRLLLDVGLGEKMPKALGCSNY